MSKRSKDFSALWSDYEQRNIRVAANPAVIYVESVKGCPYSCAMCHFRRTKPEKISPELLQKIEPYFRDLEVLTIHGLGEPLLSRPGLLCGAGGGPRSCPAHEQHGVFL